MSASCVWPCITMRHLTWLTHRWAKKSQNNRVFKYWLCRFQGKKHQSNLARRAAKEAADAPVQPAPQKQVLWKLSTIHQKWYFFIHSQGVDIKKFVKIGRPGYRVTKQRDADNGQQSLLFEVVINFGLSSFLRLSGSWTFFWKSCLFDGMFH